MQLPNRKLTRLANYDYSNENYYFITICIHNKLHLFGCDCKAERSRPFPTLLLIVDYQEIWQYIETNPLKWEQDVLY